MKSQVLHTVWCNMTGEATGEIGTSSLLGVKGLKLPHSSLSCHQGVVARSLHSPCGMNQTKRSHTERAQPSGVLRVVTLLSLHIKLQTISSIEAIDPHTTFDNWAGAILPPRCTIPHELRDYASCKTTLNQHSGLANHCQVFPPHSSLSSSLHFFSAAPSAWSGLGQSLKTTLIRNHITSAVTWKEARSSG